MTYLKYRLFWKKYCVNPTELPLAVFCHESTDDPPCSFHIFRGLMTFLLIVLLFRWSQQVILFISECFVLVQKLCLSKYFWTPEHGGALHEIEAIPVLLMCRVKMGNWHCGIVRIITDLTVNTAEPMGLCGKYKLDLQNNSCEGI